MKLRLCSFCFSVLLLGCSRDQGFEITQPAEAPGGSIESKLKEEIVARGREAASVLKGNLFNAQLQSAIESGNAAAALPVCQTAAQPITDGTADLFDGVRLSRTSLKLRNRANAPDAVDLQVLTTFQVQHDTRLEVASEIVEETDEGARYYEPIFVKKVCLNCHGSHGEMQPDVVKNLALLYPEDEAHGYAEGDFRGVIRADVTLEDDVAAER